MNFRQILVRSSRTYEALMTKEKTKHLLTLLALGFFGWCSTGGVFPTPLHNSFVFKVRLLKFCTELLWDRMNILR